MIESLPICKFCRRCNRDFPVAEPETCLAVNMQSESDEVYWWILRDCRIQWG